jgi:hypothetical protein
MPLPIEIDCPECGAKPGQRCADPEELHKNFHMMSYSFHFERCYEARRREEEK